MIEITLIGTGALIPLPDRALTSAALTCCGRTILFDCGEGTQTAARKAHVNLMKTEIIALTHYHGDHIFGLPGLLQTLFSMGREKPLYIVGPEGLREAMSPIIALAGELSYELCLLELPEGGIRLEALIPGWPTEAHLRPVRTNHRVTSQGYCFTLERAGKFQPEKAKALGVPVNLWSRLQRGEAVQAGGIVVMPEQVLGEPRKGLKFVFTGDTAPCKALELASRNADLIISEATYGENEQTDLALERGHMTFALASQTAQRASAKRIWLAHYSPRIENPLDYLPNAQEVFPDAVCGEDGMSVTLDFID